MARTVQESKNLTETCEVCHKSFKKRGLKIHQAKSGCREELDRIRKSKSVAGRLQESNHSESSSKTKPNEMTSNKETHVTGKEKKEESGNENPLQNATKSVPGEHNRRYSYFEEEEKARGIRKKLEKFRYQGESDVLVIDDETETKIRMSIVEEDETGDKVSVIRKKLEKFRYHSDPGILAIDDETEKGIMASIQEVDKANEDKEKVGEEHEEDLRVIQVEERSSDTPEDEDTRTIKKINRDIINKKTMKVNEDTRRVIKAHKITLFHEETRKDQQTRSHIVNKRADKRDIDTRKIIKAQKVTFSDEDTRTVVKTRRYIDKEEKDKKDKGRIFIKSRKITMLDEDTGVIRKGQVNEKERKGDTRAVTMTRRTNNKIVEGKNDTKATDVEKQWKEIACNINSGNQDEILSEGKFRLSRADYRSLTGCNYVNDQVMEQYFQLIKERNDADQTLPRVGILSLFLYDKLNRLGFEEGYKDTENWVETDLLKSEIILMPIHRNDHWTLIKIDNTTSQVIYYDSIIGSRRLSNAPKLIKRFLERKLSSVGETRKFQVKIEDKAPVQGNGYDCGVFVCQNAEKIARNEFVNTKQEDMPEARKRMMIELYLGSIDASHKPKPEDLSRLLERNAEKKHPERSKAAMGRNEEKTARKEGSKQSSEPRKVGKKTLRVEKSSDLSGREKIKWPNSKSEEWKRLDEDMARRLRTIIATPQEAAESHPKVILAMCKERFGVEERKESTSEKKGPSRRQRKCSELRREIKRLKKAFNEAPEEEKCAIKELADEKLRKLRLQKRAESIRKNRKEFSKNCREFLSQPFEFSRKIINPKPKGRLKSSKEDVEAHLEKVHSKSPKEGQSQNCEEMWKYPEPEHPINNDCPSFKEFNQKLRKTRTKSAPGPNGVPYRVYKRCPKVARLLWEYLRNLWERNEISNSWRKAEGIFIPKEEGASSVEKFRTISLLNVEGKIFFALKSERILDFVIENNYIDTSIQKGGVPGMSGCLEHTAVLSQLIREAKKEKKNLVVTWLDIANAYGSIPHETIFKALREAHVPEDVVNLIENYYQDVKIRFTTQNFVTGWQKVEKGIITGCTLSVVLFSLVMTYVMLSVKRETKGPKLSSGHYQVNSRLLMDDITTTTETIVQTRVLIDKLVEKLDWGGLTAKPEKCRALVIIKGKVVRRNIMIKGKPITLLQDKPIKYLGKIYNSSLNEKEQITEVEAQVKQDLKKVEKCRLPGRYKAWMFQHMLLPRLMWPLSIYNVPVTVIDRIQRKVTSSLKRWLGLPKTLSPPCFYSRAAKLRFPYTELGEEVKAAKARNLVILEESSDTCIKGAEIKIDGGSKANTPREVKEAKAKLRMKDITGIANIGNEGLGWRRRKYYNNSNKKDRRDMIVKEVREKEEDRRRIHIASLAKQGASTRWEVPEKRLSHQDIINSSETKLKFITKAVYDLLPTPANKNKWFNGEEKCKVCGEEGTLNHILAGCKVSLSQGRYKWRHDKVLRELAESIRGKIDKNRNEPSNSNNSQIMFVREGEKYKGSEKVEQSSILSSAKDWKLSTDLEGRLKIPAEISVTNLRPDITITSEETKQLILIELTVPTEERIEISGELKKNKYTPILEEGKQKGGESACGL